jgi:azurin
MRKLFLSIAVASLALASCGGGGETEAPKEEKKLQAPQKSSDYAEEEDNADVPEVAEVTIEGNDQMKYNLDKIEVYEGQTVKLTLKHVGEMAKEAMGHNWVLLKKGVDKAEYATAAVQAKDEDYTPQAMADKVIAHTKTLGGGEETTIEFEAPAKGAYEFICSFPGHYGMMNGKFIVK